VRVRRVSEKPEKDPDGRLHVRTYEDSLRAEPRPEDESAALVSDVSETSCLPGERKRPW
jgi:hypothetical protein